MSKSLTKTEILDYLASSGIDRKVAGKVLAHLAELATRELQAVGKFSVPGLVHLTLVAKPATEERQGLHPVTKTPIVVRAKPAVRKIKAVAVKGLLASSPLAGDSQGGEKGFNSHD